MTALAGATGGQARRFVEHSLARMARYGRGDPILISAGNSCLALRIHDPAGDGSSMVAQRGDLMLACDGRLDNLADIIGPDGTSADQLLSAWKTWGVELFDRLRGDFAFAIVDAARGQCWLARSVGGERPLHFTRDKDGILSFASMPSGLFPRTGVQPDLAFLAAQAEGRAHFSRRSPFRSIQRLLPGECLHFAPRAAPRRLWHWEPSLAVRRPARANALRALAASAVERRIARDGALASHLSAGIDSSIVSALAAKAIGARRPPLLCLTAAPLPDVDLDTPRHRFANETEAAHRLAEEIGATHTIVRSPSELFDSAERLLRSTQGIIGPVANLGWWDGLRAAAAAGGARVILTGEMGNSSLSAGGLPALSDWVRHGQLLRALREAKAVARRPHVRWRGILVAALGPFLPERWIDAAAKFVRHDRAASAPTFLRDGVAAGLKPDGLFPAPLTDAEVRRFDLVANDPGCSRKAALADHGVDERDPTADRDLAEYCLSLPPEARLADGRFRPLLLEAFQDLLPPEQIDPTARGFQASDAAARLSRYDLEALTAELRNIPRATELLDLDQLEHAVRTWQPARQSPLERVTFANAVSRAVMLGAFLRACAEGETAFG